MIVLAFDCASGQCAVSLRANDGRTLTRVQARQHGHAERLMPMIEGVLDEASAKYADIGRVAVTTGPGSFTGVRVGLAAAQGLGLALGVPVIGIDSFTAFRASLTEQEPCAIIIVSRRRELYWRTTEAAAQGRCDLPEQIALCLRQGHWIIGGDGAGLLPDVRPGWQVVPRLPGPDTAALAMLALDADPARHLPQPVYIRAPDAVPA